MTQVKTIKLEAYSTVEGVAGAPAFFIAEFTPDLLDDIESCRLLVSGEGPSALRECHLQGRGRFITADGREVESVPITAVVVWEGIQFDGVPLWLKDAIKFYSDLLSHEVLETTGTWTTTPTEVIG